jgi:hypothetical protein
LRLPGFNEIGILSLPCDMTRAIPSSKTICYTRKSRHYPEYYSELCAAILIPERITDSIPIFFFAFLRENVAVYWTSYLKFKLIDVIFRGY